MATNPDTKRAVFPGSFDPITRGHENILRRAAGLFDEVVVAIGVNQDKQSMFPLEQRIAWCEATFADLDNVRVDASRGSRPTTRASGETTHGGVRNGGDFEYERTIAKMASTSTMGSDAHPLHGSGACADFEQCGAGHRAPRWGGFPFRSRCSGPWIGWNAQLIFFSRAAVRCGSVGWRWSG